MRIKTQTTLTIGVLLAMTMSATLAQESTTRTRESSEPPQHRESETELNAIRARSEIFINAFNKADAKAVAALWTADGEYLDDTGETYTGRDAIENVYADFFRENPGAKIQLNIESLRMLSDGAAIEDGASLVEVPPSAAMVNRYSVVHVKVNGQWQMASVRDTLVETGTARQNLADLDWLIGSWVAEQHGTKNESVCRWVANRSFVQRDFTITSHDGSQESGVQLIGWNPQGSHVQSWTFSPDGGNAIGVWSPTESGWMAQMQGMTGEGVSAFSTNLLTRLDDNAYVWQSVDRIVGEVELPDTDEVILKRQPVTQSTSLK